MEQTGNTDGTGQATGQQADAVRTFTQEELDAIIRDRLAQDRERRMKQLREQYGDLDDLKTARERLAELEAAQLSETEKLRKQLEDMQRAVAERDQAAREAELSALRLEVGQVKGLTPTLAKRLAGATREELEADADAVLAELKPARPAAPNLNATAGGQYDKGGHALSAEERALCDKFKIPYESYAANKAKLQ